MIEEPDFESFLYISENQYIIFVDDKKNSKNLYKQEFKIDDKINPDDLSYLPKFLDENIYRIEKLVGNFIKDITLIIENDKILNTDIGIKKKDSKQLQNQDSIKNQLHTLLALSEIMPLDMIEHLTNIPEETIYKIINKKEKINSMRNSFGYL